MSPQIEAGNIYLPHPAIAPWVELLVEECTSFPNAAHDDQVDAMTQALHRLHGVSRPIHTVAESEIAIAPFEIPRHWPRAFGMDIRRNETAALWGALDPATDILYLYSEHYLGQADPAVHVKGIVSRGAWIPGVIDIATVGSSESDRWRLLQIYRDHGLDLWALESPEQSGVCEVSQRLGSGRLKVFGTLEHLFQEYRLYSRDAQGQVVKQNDLLMNCLRSLCLNGRQRMCTEPALLPPQDDFFEIAAGPGAWMR